MGELIFDRTKTNLLEIFQSYEDRKFAIDQILRDRLLCSGLSEDTLNDLRIRRDYFGRAQREFSEKLKKIANNYILE